MSRTTSLQNVENLKAISKLNYWNCIDKNIVCFITVYKFYPELSGLTSILQSSKGKSGLEMAGVSRATNFSHLSNKCSPCCF